MVKKKKKNHILIRKQIFFKNVIYIYIYIYMYYFLNCLLTYFLVNIDINMDATQ